MSTQLQFQKVVLQVQKLRQKNTFIKEKLWLVNGSCFQLSSLLNTYWRVVELNSFQETEPENEGGLTYRSSDDQAKTLSEEKAKLAKELRDARQKVLITQEQKNASPVSRKSSSPC